MNESDIPTRIHRTTHAQPWRTDVLGVVGTLAVVIFLAVVLAARAIMFLARPFHPTVNSADRLWYIVTSGDQNACPSQWVNGDLIYDCSSVIGQVASKAAHLHAEYAWLSWGYLLILTAALAAALRWVLRRRRF